VALFPLMFTGGAYLPLDSMPDWVRAIASINPLAYPIDACRALANAQPAGASIVVALAIAAIANLGGGFAAVRTFRRFEPPVRRTP
jgi:ABC-2 type transport system permease protein